MTSVSKWEKKVLAPAGAAERVAEIEEELRLAAGLIGLRERAGVSQRELAERIGVRQPRIAAIERSRNVTFDVLERYVAALGGEIELSVVRDGKRIALIGGHRGPVTARKQPAKRAAPKAAANRTTAAKSLSAKPTKRQRTEAGESKSIKRPGAKTST